MSHNRKDDHLHYARILPVSENSDFDHIHLIHQSLPSFDFSDVDLSTSFANNKFHIPLYINAMTGGTKAGEILNKKLALLAKELKIPMALGSASIILKDPDTLPTFQVARKENPDGFLIANLGVEHPIEHVLKVIDLLEADAIQIHLNVMQELIMPEGERTFKNWQNNLAKIIDKSPVPVIIKEVGFGMSQETINTLVSLGTKTIDIAGYGGTNFASIENARNNVPMPELNQWGLSTTLSLLESRPFLNQTEILASGGITTPMQAIKSLALGAKAVGLAGYLLHELDHYSLEKVILHLQEFLKEMAIIMTALNTQNIQELNHVPFVLDTKLQNWCQQRNL